MPNESEILTKEKSTGQISQWLSKNGFENSSLNEDTFAMEDMQVNTSNLLTIAEDLKNATFT